jgi:hypothetical protein
VKITDGVLLLGEGKRALLGDSLLHGRWITWAPGLGPQELPMPATLPTDWWSYAARRPAPHARPTEVSGAVARRLRSALAV